MSVEYNKLNQTVTLIKAAIPNVLPLLEQINIDPGSCYTTTDLAKVFSLYSSTSISRNVLLLPGRANGIPSQRKLWVTQILLVSTINIIHRDLHHIDILWTSYWFTTLITSCWLELIGRKLENRLYALVTLESMRNLTSLEPTTSVIFLEFSDLEQVKISPTRLNTNLCTLHYLPLRGRGGGGRGTMLGIVFEF